MYIYIYYIYICIYIYIFIFTYIYLSLFITLLPPLHPSCSFRRGGNAEQISYGLDLTLEDFLCQEGREEKTTGRERAALCAEVSKHTPSWCFGG